MIWRISRFGGAAEQATRGLSEIRDASIKAFLYGGLFSILIYSIIFSILHYFFNDFLQKNVYQITSVLIFVPFFYFLIFVYKKFPKIFKELDDETASLITSRLFSQDTLEDRIEEFIERFYVTRPNITLRELLGFSLQSPLYISGFTCATLCFVGALNLSDADRSSLASVIGGLLQIYGVFLIAVSLVSGPAIQHLEWQLNTFYDLFVNILIGNQLDSPSADEINATKEHETFLILRRFVKKKKVLKWPTFDSDSSADFVAARGYFEFIKTRITDQAPGVNFFETGNSILFQRFKSMRADEFLRFAEERYRSVHLDWRLQMERQLNLVGPFVGGFLVAFGILIQIYGGVFLSFAKEVVR